MDQMVPIAIDGHRASDTLSSGDLVLVFHGPLWGSLSDCMEATLLKTPLKSSIKVLAKDSLLDNLGSNSVAKPIGSEYKS